MTDRASDTPAGRVTILVTVLASGVLSGCALMVPPEKDPTNIRLTELDARLARVERVIDSDGLVNLLKQIEQLQADNQALREQVDQLQFKLDQAGTAQKQQYVDVDQRLQSLEKALGERKMASADARSVLDGGELRPGQLPVPGGTDRANYQAAFELLKQGRYKEASAALKQFMVAFPGQPAARTTPSTGSRKPTTSARATTRPCPSSPVVVEKYPKSRKIPDALLKIGYCNYELKRFDAARKALQTVVANYPETTAARLAGQRLERMTTEGL